MGGSNQKSIFPATLAVILFVMAAIISYSNNSSDPQPHHENAARMLLGTLFQSCKMLWSTEGDGKECTIEAVSQPPYTFFLESQDAVERGEKIDVQLARVFENFQRYRIAHSK